MDGRGERGPLENNHTDWRRACAELVHAHYAGIYRFLLHLTRDADCAADLTQETFAAAWAKLRDFEGRSDPFTWLHRIAYCKYVDAQRKRQRCTTMTARLQSQYREPDSPDPLALLLANERWRRLYEAVQALDDEADRVVITLHYLQELSFREMAAVLEEPAGTVKWRTSRALTRLRNLMTQSNAHVERPKTTTP